MNMSINISLFEIFLLILAYLIGSIPMAVWFSKFFFKMDIREKGSKNAGATNIGRVLGFKYGIIILILDILKAFVACKLILLTDIKYPSTEYYNFLILLGIAAIIGHILPVFANFNGGKGVATYLGVLLAFNETTLLIFVIVFVILFVLFRYVSLGSIVASLSFPIFVILSHSLMLYPFILPIIIIITHQKNIERLLNGVEKKYRFKK